ncbi:hypothetical protein [Actinomycetospora atypica]|uniref:Uncharacterized protein n=1 Tax=Actinomycetospora atypica TaxID=1290095 RepID=A0ABV9YJ81_9PSEU
MINQEERSVTNLLDFIGDFPRLTTPLAKLEGKAPALSARAVPSGDYVWPDLSGIVRSQSAKVMLVEAAGAVGKSEAARAISQHLNWPLIDSARMQVGDYTLTGQVFAAFGMDSEFLPKMSRGEVGLVIDALDEAHLKAGTSNFQAFLENIAWFANGTTANVVNIFLFSRPDTADLIRAQFEETGLPLDCATISFFTKAQADSFMDSHLARKNSAKPGRNYDVSAKAPVPFGQFRDAQLNEIAGALTNDRVDDVAVVWESVREFLGYAPVLSVLAEFLAVPNPHASLKSDLARDVAPDEILLQIITEILDREQGKFHDNKLTQLYAKLPANVDWPNRSDVYSADEQAVRLVSRHLDLELRVELPASVPVSIRDSYEQAAKQFTADHPFLAGREALNVVFGDFIKAKASIDAKCKLSLTPDPAAAVIGAGPFFARFVHRFAPVVAQSASVHEDLLPLLLDSHISSMHRSPRYIAYTYMQGQEVSLMELEYDDSLFPLSFIVEDPSGVSSFPDRLTRGLILCDDTVVLGTRRQVLVLGPYVTVVAADILIEAERLSVEPGLGTVRPPSILFGRDTVQANYLTGVDSYGEGSLVVYGDTVWPRLQAFQRKIEVRDKASFSDYVHLRALIKAFRQGAGSMPSVYGELLDKRIVKESPVRLKFLNRMVELKIVVRQEGHYYLSTSELGKFGISWGAVVDGSPSNEVLELIARLNAP